MSTAERVLIEAEIIASEARAKFLREQLKQQSGESIPGSPTKPTRRARRPQKVVRPDPAELDNVRDLDSRRVEEAARQQGHVS